MVCLGCNLTNARQDCWTHLYGFDAVRHGRDSSLWTPYKASIEALIQQVENSPKRAQDFRASLVVLVYLVTPNESSIMRNARTNALAKTTPTALLDRIQSSRPLELPSCCA
jgi:hypothetical protein